MENYSVFHSLNIQDPKKEITRGKYNVFMHIGNELYGWGNNDWGQLGLGKDKKISARTFKDVKGYDKKIRPLTFIDISHLNLKKDNTIVQVEAAENYTLLLTSKGDLFSSGRFNLVSQTDSFTKINLSLDSEEQIIKVATGKAHSILLTSKGNCYVAGLNLYGELGTGSMEAQHNFLKLNLNSITEIYAGDHHTILKTSDGDYYSFGRNQSGQLGLEEEKIEKGNGVPPIKIRFDQCSPQLFWQKENKKIISLAVGGNHNLCLLDSGEIYGWGSNLCGQLGVGKKEGPMIIIPSKIDLNALDLKDDQIEQVAAGGLFSMLLTKQGRLFSAGSNLNGELGQGDRQERQYFVEIDLKNFNLNHEDKIIKLKLGADFVIAESQTGRYFAWGNNNYGQLGLISKENYLSLPQEIIFNVLEEEKESFTFTL